MAEGDRPVCGQSGLTVVVECGSDPTLQWQRWASVEEVAQLREMGELPPEETAALVPVFGCDEHKIDPDESAEFHDSTCRAPDLDEPGACSVCAP